MVKKIFFCQLAVIALTGCYHSKAEKAIIRMPDGSLVNGDVESWFIYNNGATAKNDGITYKTHYSNVVVFSGEDLPAKE